MRGLSLLRLVLLYSGLFWSVKSVLLALLEEGFSPLEPPRPPPRYLGGNPVGPVAGPGMTHCPCGTNDPGMLTPGLVEPADR